MNNDMNKYLNEAVEEGIITNKQRLELKLKLGRDKVDNGRRMSRVGDLVLAIIFIILIMSSCIMLITNNNSENNFVGIVFSVVCVMGSIFVAYDSIRKNNYFLKELAVVTNALSNIMLVTSFNQIMTYDYYFPDNIYIGCIMTLPLFLVINTYISKLMVIVVFCIFRVPYFNLAYTPLYNTTLVSIITICITIVTAYKLGVFLKREDNDVEARFLTLKMRIALQEIALWLLIMKINRIFLGDENIIIIYTIYIILLIRRSSVFKNALEMPIIIDNIFFIYTVFFFARFDVDVWHEWDILLCHIIYYVVYFSLLKNDKLKDVDKIYKVQQQFYINLFLLTYIIFNLQHSYNQEYLFLILILVGIFNVYQGKVGMRLEFVVIGLLIVLIALVFTASVAYSLATIIIIILSLLFVLQKVWRKIKEEVLRDNEK